MVILIMGVSGSGKTTVGEKLAATLGWKFLDADEVHPASNIAKMAAGHPLTDEDRAPWLAALRARIDDFLRREVGAVVTCSALKERYRDVLLSGTHDVKLVHLRGSPELLRSRLRGRVGHFMAPNMLDSQLAELEPPKNALVLDVVHSPEELIQEIRQTFKV
jgi:gluconokinase